MSAYGEDHGVSVAVRSSDLADHLATPLPNKEMHLRIGSTDAAICGTSSQWLTEAVDCVTCESCRLEATRRQDLKELLTLKKLAVAAMSVRSIDRKVRDRLTKIGQAKVLGAGVYITSVGRERVAKLKDVG